MAALVTGAPPPLVDPSEAATRGYQLPKRCAIDAESVIYSVSTTQARLLPGKQEIDTRQPSQG
jgi:hypothetical protein